MGILMLITLVAASCTQSKDSQTGDILNRIPDNADMVFVGNLNTIIEAAGGSAKNGQITLPPYISEILSETQQAKWEETKKIINDSGVDTDVCAVMAYYEKETEEYPVIIFHLSDKDKFLKFIESNGYQESYNENGTVIYNGEETETETEYGPSTQYNCIGVNDAYAYYVPQIAEGMYDPYMSLDYIIGRAAESPYSKTAFASYLTSGNAMGAAIKTPIELSKTIMAGGMPLTVKNMPEGVICMTGDMEKEKMTVKVKYCDNEGKPLNVLGDCSALADTKARINADALAYLGENECFVEAVSLKNMDWDKSLQLVANNMSRTERATLPIIKQYLEKIDGTVAIGMGLNDGVDAREKLNTTPLTAVSFSLIIETKNGEARKLLDDAQNMLESFGMQYEKTSDGISMAVPGMEGFIALEAHGDIIVLANHKIAKSSKQPVLKAFDFGKHQAAMVLCLGRDNKLMSDMKVKNDVLLSVFSNAEESEATMELQIKGGKSDGIIANAADIAKTVGKSLDSLKPNRN